MTQRTILFRGHTDFNESIYDRLHDCFDSDDQKIITDSLIRAFTFADIEKVIEIFVSDKMANNLNDCMPDNISSKADHEQYLKDIGHDKYIRRLEHHKDTTVGLWATDRPDLIEDKFKIMFQLTF